MSTDPVRGDIESPTTYPVYWHVGLPKTGSTYLQQRVFPRFTGLSYIDKPSRQVLQKIETMKRFSPVLYSREVTGAWAEKAQWMARSHPEARPIIVLRRHSDHIASWYRNRLKNGGRCTFEQYVDLDRNQGLRPTSDFCHFEKIKRLDEALEYKPYILFYDDLKANPDVFLRDLADYLGLGYEPADVNRQAANPARGDRQLKAVRRLAPYLLPSPQPKGGWLRRTYRRGGRGLSRRRRAWPPTHGWGTRN